MHNAISGDSLQAIVEIDKSARERVLQAEEEARKIISGADEKKKTMLSDYEQRAEARLKKVELSYKAEADEEIAEIEKRKNSVIENLDAKMAENRERWKKEIFSAVTGE